MALPRAFRLQRLQVLDEFVNFGGWVERTGRTGVVQGTSGMRLRLRHPVFEFEEHPARCFRITREEIS